MIKSICLLVFSVVFSVTLFAQEKGAIEFGGNLGVNISRVSNIDNGTTDSRTSFNIAASGEYYFSDRWGVKTKLIYDSKGWSNGFVYDMDNGVNTITDFKLNYITIPVMANWHFGSTRKWYLNFGPYVGFLASAKDSKLGRDFKSAFNTTDYGLAYGIGYKFLINEKIKMFVEYEIESGFTDIFKDSFYDSVTTGRSAFNLGVLMILK